MRRLSCESAIDIDFVYRKSPRSTVMSLPHRLFTLRRPRRTVAWSMMSSWRRVAVWMNSTTEASTIARSPRKPHVRQASRSRAGRMRLPPPSRM